MNLPFLGIILPNMGMKDKTFGLSDALFSKVQQRVMALLFGQPDRSFYTSEILRHVDSGVGAVDRELTRLQAFATTFAIQLYGAIGPALDTE